MAEVNSIRLMIRETSFRLGKLAYRHPYSKTAFSFAARKIAPLGKMLYRDYDAGGVTQELIQNECGKLSLFVAHNFRNLLLGLYGDIPLIRSSLKSAETKTYALRAAVMLGQNTKQLSALLLKDIEAMVGSAEILERFGMSYGRLVESVQGQVPDKGISARISEQLKKIVPVTPGDATSARLIIENIKRARKALMTGGTRTESIETAVADLPKQIKALAELLEKVHRSAEVCTKTVENLVYVLQNSNRKSPFPEDLDAYLQGLDSLKAMEELKQVFLPLITKEMAACVNVLIVDDEPAVRSLFKARFERDGYRVTAAENGRQALDIFTGAHFDLVISDVTMPVMGGVALTRAIRQLKREVPVCLFSGTPLEADAELSDFIAQGNARFIVKVPHNIEKVLRMAIAIAAEKAGIETKEEAQAAPAASKPAKKPEPIQIFRERLAHKLNNDISVVIGFFELFLTNPKHFEAFMKGYERCKNTIGVLRRYAEEFRARPNGDIELLPDSLRNDEKAKEAVRQLSSLGTVDYNNIARICATTVVMYEALFMGIDRLLELFEKEKDRSRLDEICALIKSFAYINTALMGKPLNEDTEFATDTINIILNNE